MYSLNHVLARNDKGTPYHWIYIYQRGGPSEKVFAIRAWGKRPQQAKSMCFSSQNQANAYYEKWKDGKLIELGPKEISASDKLDDVVLAMKMSFPWIDINEHRRNLNEAMGLITDEYVEASRMVETKKTPAKQLPASYGWW